MSQFDEASVPQRNPKAACRVIDGQALVVVLEKREVHRLDSVGTHIWELCDGRSVGAIVDGVVDEFEVERAVALTDTIAFLAQLTSVGAVLDVQP